MLHTTPRRRLQDDLAAVEQIAARPATTAKELAANLTELYDATFNINFERYDVQTLVASAPDIARTVFAMRLRLRDQVADWHARGFLTLAGQRALRNALRIARYATDMLGEINIRYAQLGPGETTLRGFSGRNMNTLLNPAFDTGHDLDFRSGDLLLMRGMHHNSAAIARIGDVDSQFSHLAIVHTDESGKHWVVEALIEEGSVINPLSYTLTHGLGRCVLFRHRDKQLAARAAALIHEVVRRSGEKGGKHIWYDFTMELERRQGAVLLQARAQGLRARQRREGAAADVLDALRHEEPRLRRPHRRHRARRRSRRPTSSSSRISTSSPSGRTIASPRACACRIC